MNFVKTLIYGFGVRYVCAKGTKHFVDELPGWSGKLPVPLYTGKIHIQKTVPNGVNMFMQYYLFKNPNADANTPTVVWYNGGPGASSAFGLFVELGPYMLNAESYLSGNANKTGVPDLIYNPYAWTSFAHVIAFDNPPPTGFSYCDPPGPAGHGDACGTWNDTRVGVINAEALDTLFVELYPDLLNDAGLWLTGESYAGVYITETTREIALNSEYKRWGAKLKGAALGDACLGRGPGLPCGDHGIWPEVQFLWGHGQVPPDLWDDTVAACPGVTAMTPGNDPKYTKTCNDAISKLLNAAGYSHNWAYDLYIQCPTIFNKKLQTIVPGSPQVIPVTGTEQPKIPFDYIQGYWCPGNVFNDYVLLPAVRDALHVPRDAYFFSGDNAVGMKYNFTLQNAFDRIWAQVLGLKNSSEPLNTPADFHLMAYTGDADPAVGTFITSAVWFNFAKEESLVVSQPWRMWFWDDYVTPAGFVQEWKKGRLSYVTIRGSGHMVPEFQPRSAYTLIKQFVHNQPLPDYKKN